MLTSQPNNVIRNKIAVVYSGGKEEEDLAKAYAEMIRREGYEVDLFTDPMLASEKIGSQHSIYLLAVIGWRMPRLTGYELALNLTKIDPEIKIILFSSQDPYDVRRMYDRASADVVKFDHFSLGWLFADDLLYAIKTKIKNGKFDEFDILDARDILRNRIEGYDWSAIDSELWDHLRRQKRNN